MSRLAEELNTYVKMVSDNLIKEKHYQSIHDILQAHPKEVDAFKSNPHNFPIQKHKEFYKDLWDLYSNSGEMPHEVVTASSEKYKAQWIMDKLHDEVSSQEPEDFDPHDDASNDHFDMDLDYDEDWDTLGFDPAYENNKVKEELPHTEGPPLADKIHDSLHNTWMNGGEEALQAEMKMDDKDWQNAITDISINTGWHQDDDREEIITKIIDDYVDNYATGESTTPISKMKHLAGL